jgi:hypothetical protein
MQEIAASAAFSSTMRNATFMSIVQADQFKQLEKRAMN